MSLRPISSTFQPISFFPLAPPPPLPRRPPVYPPVHIQPLFTALCPTVSRKLRAPLPFGGFSLNQRCLRAQQGEGSETSNGLALLPLSSRYRLSRLWCQVVRGLLAHYRHGPPGRRRAACSEEGRRLTRVQRPSHTQALEAGGDGGGTGEQGFTTDTPPPFSTR